MDCEEIKKLVIDYIDDSLDINEAHRVDEHFSSCEKCRTELMEMKSIWQELDTLKIEQLSGSVKKNIENMIDSYNLGMNNNTKIPWYLAVSEWLESWWPKRPLIQFSVTVAVVIISFVIGFGINKKTQSQKQTVQLKTETRQLQKVVMRSLLNESSAVDRISGLSMTGRLKNVNKEFYSTLLLILNSDSNVNVRLAAVNALAKFTGSEYVRRELVKSLGLQSSPLVQISLIDLLTTIKEPESPSVLINIINDPEANMYVKEQAKKALKHFI